MTFARTSAKHKVCTIVREIVAEFLASQHACLIRPTPGDIPHDIAPSSNHYQGQPLVSHQLHALTAKYTDIMTLLQSTCMWLVIFRSIIDLCK